MMIMFRESLDAESEISCYNDMTGSSSFIDDRYVENKDNAFKPEFPSIDFIGFGEGDNSAVMFYKMIKYTRFI